MVFHVKKINSAFTIMVMAGISFLTTGCQSTDNFSAKKQAERMMCTAQYDPVCATIESKTQPKVLTKVNFSNSCALNNSKDIILSSKKGACKK